MPMSTAGSLDGICCRNGRISSMTNHLSRYSRILPRHTKEFTLTWKRRLIFRKTILITTLPNWSLIFTCYWKHKRGIRTRTASEDVCKQADLIRGISAFFMDGYSIRLANVGMIFRQSSCLGKEQKVVML